MSSEFTLNHEIALGAKGQNLGPSKHMTRYETALGKKLVDRTGPSVGLSDSFRTT